MGVHVVIVNNLLSKFCSRYDKSRLKWWFSTQKEKILWWPQVHNEFKEYWINKPVQNSQGYEVYVENQI